MHDMDTLEEYRLETSLRGRAFGPAPMHTDGLVGAGAGTMTAMRWLARLILATAVLIQLGYAIRTYAGSHDAAWWYPLALTLAFSGSIVFDRGYAAGFLRIVLGLIFAVSASDRFGVFHKAGPVGAAIAPLAHLVGFAPRVDVAFPAHMAARLSMVAAWGEALLAVALISGVASRVFCSLAAMLLAAYTVAILQTSGLNAVLGSAAVVLFGASLLLAASAPLSMGAGITIGRRRELDPFLFAFDEAQRRASRFRRV
jgi:uncharacterized membrane protein YphA (DoxX/SURF4 family)